MDGFAGKLDEQSGEALAALAAREGSDGAAFTDLVGRFREWLGRNGPHVPVAHEERPGGRRRRRIDHRHRHGVGRGSDR